MKTDEADLPDSSFIKVVVAFTVNKTGRVSDVSILENNCKGCSREMKTDLQEQVTRIIKKYPIKPKKNSQGKPVVTHYKQPIYFRIED